MPTELELRQKREQIPPRTLLLAVEDPETRVGSGGATLNALLVAAEHLSARAGFTVSAHKVPSSGTCSLQNRDSGLKHGFQGPQLFWPHRPARSAFGISFCFCQLGRLIQGRAEGRANLHSGFRKLEPISQS